MKAVVNIYYMGEAEWIKSESIIRIHSDFYFYGDAASPELAETIANGYRQSLE